MALFAFSSGWEPAPRPTPSDATLLAIGDVHGCSAQLDALLGCLKPVIDSARDRQRRCELILLGDYVDRGPDSLGVLQRLSELRQQVAAQVHLLRGNHDRFLIEQLRPMPDPDLLELWCENGGDSLLAEIGISLEALVELGPSEVAERLRRRLGPDLIQLLVKLPGCRLFGSYLFVHGGVHPQVPLQEHSLQDLLWMREPFLSATTWSHPFTVVHGHTPLGPEVFAYRIGVDSGCFFTGALTALELADDKLRFHGVTSDLKLRAFRELLNPTQARTFSVPVPCPGDSRMADRDRIAKDGHPHRS